MSIGKTLFWKVKILAFFEKLQVIFLFYRNPRFALGDLFLLLRTFLQNPYRTCRKYWSRKNQLHQVYGETPLTEFVRVVKWAEMQKEDHFLEMGSGLGRLSFWVALQGIKATGIEKVPSFHRMSLFLQRLVKNNNLYFFSKDLKEVDFSWYTFIYFYATVKKEEDLRFFFSQMKATKKGTKILSVSVFPGEYFPKSFLLIKKRRAAFPWGKATVFLSQKI